MAEKRSFKRPAAFAAAVAILAVGAYYARPPDLGKGGSVPTETSEQGAPLSGADSGSVAGAYPRPAFDPAASPVDPVALRAAIAQERMVSAKAEAQAPKTYIGPDGKPQEIVYNQSFILSLTPVEKEQYEAEMLDQLKQNPEAFAKLYNLDPKFVEEVAAGRKPFPTAVLQ